MGLLRGRCIRSVRPTSEFRRRVDRLGSGVCGVVGGYRPAEAAPTAKDKAPILAAMAVIVWAPSMSGLILAIVVGAALALFLYNVDERKGT